MYYTYKKAIDQYTTYQMLLPEAGENEAQPFELGTIDGITYVVVPDGMILPQQPKQIAVKAVVPDQAIIDKLSDVCPVIVLIRKRMLGLEPKTRLSKQDELTLGLITEVVKDEVVDEKTVTLADFVTDCRTWDKSVVKPIDEIIITR